MIGEVLNNEGGPWSGRDPGDKGAAGDGSGLGPRNPWTEPPAPRKPGKGRPPMSPAAFEALIRQGRARFRGRLPEGRGRGWWAWGVVAVLLLWVLLTSIHRIDPRDRGVVTRLGRYAGVLDPGLQLTLPAPFDHVRLVRLETRTIDIGSTSPGPQTLLMTRDHNLVNVAYTVQWKVRQPALYVLALGAPADQTVQQVAESAMRAEFTGVDFRDVAGQRGIVEARAARRIQEVLDRYGAGILVQRVTIRQAIFPAAVADATREVATAQQDELARLRQAQDDAEKLVGKAATEAESFNKVYAQYRLAPEVTRRRMYYETMEAVLSRVDKTIVDAPGVQSVLPLPAPRHAPAGQP